MGTLAGNLSIKHKHNEFPSDIYIFLEALDANIVVIGTDSKVSKVPVAEYLKMEMNKKIIIKIIVSARPAKEYIFNSYKVLMKDSRNNKQVFSRSLVKFFMYYR